MSEITKAIAARQAQIVQLQNDIETLRRAASIVGGKGTAGKAPSQATAKPKPKPKPKRKKRKPRAKATGSPRKPKTTRTKKPTWSAADREAISRRMKAYWAKRRKARR